MRYTVRPLSDRTWLRPKSARKASRFDSSWGATEELLGREIDLLGGRDIVIEVDVREQDIRMDGTLRANAREAEQPGVVVAFDTADHGPMLYRCDRFYAQWRGQVDWQHNVRAIALTLEALRAVDRYGATETGQQYAGFKALPAGRAMPSSTMSRREAAEVLELAAIGDEGALRERTIERILSGQVDLGALMRNARAVTHPDRNAGDRAAWDRVEQAVTVLGARG